MIEKEIVTRLAEEQLAFSDCYLVDVPIKQGNLIVVEIDHDTAVGIDDCVALSRYIEERIDRDVEDYELEVGSAGLGMPFKIVRQYVKNIGNEVEAMLNNGKKLKGVLKSADENGVTVEDITRGLIPLSYNEIKYIKNIIKFK
jgi:ribosome maturation factor RimP